MNLFNNTVKHDTRWRWLAKRQLNFLATFLHPLNLIFSKRKEVSQKKDVQNTAKDHGLDKSSDSIDYNTDFEVKVVGDLESSGASTSDVSGSNEASSLSSNPSCRLSDLSQSGSDLPAQPKVAFP